MWSDVTGLRKVTVKLTVSFNFLLDGLTKTSLMKYGSRASHQFIFFRAAVLRFVYTFLQMSILLSSIVALFTEVGGALHHVTLQVIGTFQHKRFVHIDIDSVNHSSSFKM